MKTIGLIGGMSWESSALYYQQLNRQIQQRYGGLHSAQVILNSVNFHDIEVLQRENRWDEAGQYLAKIAVQLEAAGADIIALCTNTMHKVAAEIESAIYRPFLHIADATIQAIQQQKIQRVGLLGTAFTMQQDFYKGRLLAQGIDVQTPSAHDQIIIHDVIYHELCRGHVLESSKQQYLNIIQAMIEQGIEGVILGCTEIGLLIQQQDLNIPVFDTTQIHVNALVDFALSL
ncbi:aspartate/glutamate racemase family protein [Acinetobacter sp. 251-1]|uniref:aspartate/glutamate racemase family protein n=1 Tax=Acinetobacter sp. 251-1 TaxID=2746720 RepID=UPI0025763CE0|nr:aspartate/glutamate racemase family protein [Acinetobacter sp. 251-1]MDM1760439.1 aspartate/glutamate racemase family protein [Acinetobacter sp. 251-1]